MDAFQIVVEKIREIYKQPDGFIPLHAPVFAGNEKKYLEECIDTTFVSSVGKYVDLFEEKIAEYTGASKAVACVNGTNALHLSLKLVGVQPNTEVITQPLTFVATANAISYCGAKAVFLDVDANTLGLSPQALRSWLETSTFKRFNQTTNKQETINKTTRLRISACIPMHTFGHPCRIDEIIAICQEYCIPVVEDAAESLGSFYKNQHTGTFGEIGVLSFNGNKIITTGGGGMILFKDKALAQKAKHLTTQAKVPHQWEFDHDEIGYNYRMPNINAALGFAQLEQLPKFLESKRKIAETYKSFFSTLAPTMEYIPEPLHASSNHWLNCILLPDKELRDAFLKFTNEVGVMTRPAWRLMNELKMFAGEQQDDLETAREIANRLVNIPSSCCKLT